MRILIANQPVDRKFPISNSLTPSQRYWLAYMDDRLATTLHAAADAETAPQARLNLQTRSFEFTMHAGMVMPQLGEVDRAEWIDLQRSLGGREEFITPLIERMESIAQGFEARGDRDHAISVRDLIWAQRIALVRFDPTRLADTQARFEAERPGEPFDAFLAEQFVRGRRVLPEGTLETPGPDDPDINLRSLRGEWRLLEVWDTACEACRSTLAIADTLAREFPDRVLAVAAHAAPEQARLYLAGMGFVLPPQRHRTRSCGSWACARCRATSSCRPTDVSFP